MCDCYGEDLGNQWCMAVVFGGGSDHFGCKCGDDEKSVTFVVRFLNYLLFADFTFKILLI